MNNKVRCFLLLLFFCHATGMAQLNNSWIDYGKTYFSFRIAKDSLIRIGQPALANLGLASVNADHFQLWRNGEQVRIFTSVAGVALGPSDYIEFYGERNDGRPDNQLYRNSDHQLNQEFSLETDTVVYYLTVNNTGNNLRYAGAVNPPAGAMVPEPYYMRNADLFLNSFLCRGYANIVGEYIYSSLMTWVRDIRAMNLHLPSTLSEPSLRSMCLLRDLLIPSVCGQMFLERRPMRGMSG
jgi:hypothetical protein